MSHLLHTILFGSWVEPEVKSVRSHSCLRGCAERERFESESYANLQLELLRFMRDYPNRWFSPAEIKLNVKMRFSVGGLGVVLRKMAEEEFLCAKQNGKRTRIQVYKFNGIQHDDNNRD